MFETITNQTNTRSIIGLAEKFIDYAGMFPPAKLPLNEAFANYVRYAGDQYNWLLSRFICPANQLMNLADLIKQNFEYVNYPISISVLGKGGDNIKDFRNEVLNDINAFKAFRSRFSTNFEADIYEIKLPEELLFSKDEQALSDVIKFTIDEIEEKVGNDIRIYFEGIYKADWDNSVDIVTEVLSNLRAVDKNVGYKVRLGAFSGIDIPSCRQVAVVLLNCLDRSLPIKATQGLHHPFRHYSEEVHGKMHGFINLFVAGILANRHNLEGDVVIKILEDENPENFVFTDESLSWKGFEVDIDWIKYGREDFMNSFGTCSVEEPIEDLQKLNLI